MKKTVTFGSDLPKRGGQFSPRAELPDKTYWITDQDYKTALESTEDKIPQPRGTGSTPRIRLNMLNEDWQKWNLFIIRMNNRGINRNDAMRTLNALLNQGKTLDEAIEILIPSVSSNAAEAAKSDSDTIDERDLGKKKKRRTRRKLRKPKRSRKSKKRA